MNTIIFGVSDGRICIYEFDGTSMDADALPVCEWAGHHHSIGGVFHAQRSARRDGSSALFHTHLGGCIPETTHDFVLSIGCGSGYYPGLAAQFPNSVQGGDYVLNAWIL